MVERESTETMIPSLNLKARVVVPLANLTVCPASLLPEADAKLALQKLAGYDRFEMHGSGYDTARKKRKWALLTSGTLGRSNAAGCPKTN